MSASTDWASLHVALQELASSGNAEVHEAGKWLAELDGFRWEIHHNGENSLLHLWSDAKTLTRRVLDIKEQSPGRIVLEVQRFGRAKPSRIEFLRPQSARLPLRVAREQFRVRLRGILEKNFPDAAVESLTAIPDLKHSFSGVYVRGGVAENKRTWAVFAVRPGESSVVIKDALAFGILWLDWVRTHSTRRAVEGLRMILPRGTSGLVFDRLAGIHKQARIEIFELNEADDRLQKIEPSTGNLESWLVPRGERESLLNQARAVAAGIHALAAHMPPAGNEITTRLAPSGMQALLAFRGLEFANFSRDGLFFGMKERRIRYEHRQHAALDQLMFQLDLYRSPLASDTKHPLYRAAPERWIETLVLADPSRLVAQLDPRHLYSQVPAVGADRGIVDLLGVTRRGRLVVLELKASEDLQAPVQALDYWLRIRRLQLEGAFQRLGYFQDMTLSSEPPLMWLVAPGLHFHAAADVLQKYLLPEIRVTRIGITESWRRGIKVVFRQQDLPSHQNHAVV